MANPTGGFFQTLVSAAVDLKRPLTLKKSMLSKVYIHDQPVAGTVGQTININIPIVNVGNVVDIGAGGIQIADANHTPTSIVINRNPSSSRIIREFHQTLTPENLRTLYLQPMIEEVGRYVNQTVCNLVTAGNFNLYSSITGGNDVFSRPNVTTAWANLTGAGVPVEDSGNFHFVTGHVPFSNMLGDTTQGWISENVVGINAAEMAQQTARFMPGYGALFDYDQQFPQPSPGATFAGLMFHKNAIAIAPVIPSEQDAPHVQTTTFQPEGSGLTFRIQSWYEPAQQGQVIHCHCMYGLALIRPEYGTFLVTT